MDDKFYGRWIAYENIITINYKIIKMRTKSNTLNYSGTIIPVSAIDAQSEARPNRLY